MKVPYSSLVNAALTTVLVTSLLFMATGTTTSRVDNRLASGAVYNPWLDTDDNGIINMLDLYNVALIYGTTGTPINKTALVTDIENRIAALEAKFPVNNTNLAADAIPYVYSEMLDGPYIVSDAWQDMFPTYGPHIMLNRSSHVIITLTAQFNTTDGVSTDMFVWMPYPYLLFVARPGAMTVLKSPTPPASTGWHIITIVYTCEVPAGYWTIQPQCISASYRSSEYWFRSMTVYALPA